MKFEHELFHGTLIKRYKRFLADVKLGNGEIVTAHCANSGSMLTLKDEGNEVWLSPAANPKAKLDYKWEIVKAGDVILSGALGKFAAASPGDNFSARIEGLGSVSVSFGQSDN